MNNTEQEDLLKALEKSASRWEWAADNIAENGINRSWCLRAAKDERDTLEKVKTFNRNEEHTILILRLLSYTYPYYIPFDVLLDEINLVEKPPITKESLEKHLQWLKARDIVNCFRVTLDDNASTIKWRICRAGIEALRNNAILTA